MTHAEIHPRLNKLNSLPALLRAPGITDASRTSRPCASRPVLPLGAGRLMTPACSQLPVGRPDPRRPASVPPPVLRRHREPGAHAAGGRARAGRLDLRRPDPRLRRLQHRRECVSRRAPTLRSPLPVADPSTVWEIWTKGLYKSTLHRVVHRGSNYRCVGHPASRVPHSTST